MSKKFKLKLQANEREISWLLFNDRVLQEAEDLKNPIHERLRFLGIFSNNLDEFFRVRVANLQRSISFNVKEKKDNTKNNFLLENILDFVQQQQTKFNNIFNLIFEELKTKKIELVNNKNLTSYEAKYINQYFIDHILTHISPLMIESLPQLPNLNERNIYLACALGNLQMPLMQTYCLIEVPTDSVDRFIIIPTNQATKKIILLEDIIRHCLPLIFEQFGFNSYETAIIKVTRDSELNLDNDVNTSLIELEKKIKNRNKGQPTRFIYEKGIDEKLLVYLIGLLKLKKNDTVIGGLKIHNFRDFINFPEQVFDKKDLLKRQDTFIHPKLKQPVRILNVIKKQDVLLHTPYHKFDSIIDFLREVSIDPYINTIHITCYRLAKNSKVVNALINAARNGKKVIVVLELKARFDEAANIKWTRLLIDEGITVLSTPPNRKIHAKICVATKLVLGKKEHYGFISTGNLNEQTAKIYADYFLLTANQQLLEEALKVFNQIEQKTIDKPIKDLLLLTTSPYNTRRVFIDLINKEILNHNKKTSSGIIIKVNSLSDALIITHLEKAIVAGVPVKLIVRGICCIKQKFLNYPNVTALSILDSYLEHARVFWFCNKNKPLVYFGSADFMTRNLDYRIEATCKVMDKDLAKELYDVLQIQLKDNVKARLHDGTLENKYNIITKTTPQNRSQISILQYLKNKK